VGGGKKYDLFFLNYGTTTTLYYFIIRRRRLGVTKKKITVIINKYQKIRHFIGCIERY
jgi:hypothetical protein